jgi:hypothetical protein
METVEYSKPLQGAKELASKAASPVGALVLTGIAVIIGLALRFSQLGTASLWFDEGYTAWAVSHPVGEIVRIVKVDTAPPLYYILLRGWTHLFGFSESALRSMSALMSAIGLLFFVALARKMLKSPWATATATALFSLSFMQIAYAHEARFYAMMTMLESIDLYLVLLVCERSSVSRLSLVATAWIASLYTNNMMVFYLGSLGIAWILLPGERPITRRLRDAVTVAVLSAIAFAPWVPVLLAQTKRISGGFWPSKPDALLVQRTFAVLAGVHEQGLPLLRWKWHTLLNVNFLGVDLLLLGLVLLACTSLRRLRTVLAIAIAGLLPILLIYMYSMIGTSIFMERAFLATGVATPLLVVLAIDSVKSKPGKILAWTGALAFVAMSIMSVPNHQLGEHAEAWREACAFALESPAKHRLVVCVSNDGEPLYRYYACNRDYGPRADVTAVPASFFALDPPRTLRRVTSDRDLDGLRNTLATGDFDEVTLISSHTMWGDPEGRTLDFLNDQMVLTCLRKFSSVEVYRFKPGPAD